MEELSNETSELIAEILQSIKNKRARVVVEHILKHGYITTEDLENYGYKHPPRAARDVREAGIPLKTFRVRSSDGSRTIAAYKFGDLTEIRKGRLQGRKVFPRKLKKSLYEASNGKCAICSGHFEIRYLQIDHRIPYEIAGDIDANREDLSSFMLLCGSCNRAKSWSCEHCPNWDSKSAEKCLGCYWAFPENHTHVALMDVRRIDILFAGSDEVEVYERLKEQAGEKGSAIPDYVKRVLEKFVKKNA